MQGIYPHRDDLPREPAWWVVVAGAVGWAAYLFLYIWAFTVLVWSLAG